VPRELEAFCGIKILKLEGKYIGPTFLQGCGRGAGNDKFDRPSGVAFLYFGARSHRKGPSKFAFQ